MTVGIVAAIFFLQKGALWATYIMGLGAFQSLRILQAGGVDIEAADIRPRTPIAEAEPMISAAILSILRRARKAVADDELDKARVLCDELLARDPDAENAPPPNARREALEILAWVALANETTNVASAKLEEAQKLGEVDAALIGALHFAKREMKDARRVLEAALARGDERRVWMRATAQIRKRDAGRRKRVKCEFAALFGLSAHGCGNCCFVDSSHRCDYTGLHVDPVPGGKFPFVQGRNGLQPACSTGRDAGCC